MVFVLAPPMCFHHNSVCDGITCVFFITLFVMVLLFALFFVPMLSLQHSSIALGSKLTSIT